MRSVRYDPERGVEVVDVAVPTLAVDEVLIEVKACGLCGTDAEILFGERRPVRAVTLGHEIAGLVREVGSATDRAILGRRVVVPPIVSCGACRACDTGAGHLCTHRAVIGLHRDGGLAELVCVPARNVVDLPDVVSMEHGAIAIDAVATPLHALKDRAKLTSGENVVVFGVGGLGQHAVQLALVLGAATVVAIDPRPEARNLAAALGAHAVIDSADPRAVGLARKATGGRGADVALGFAGGEVVVQSMLACLDAGGRAVMVAMTHEEASIPSPGAMVQQETALMGSYGFTRQTVEDVLQLISTGRLDLSASISHRIALDESPGLLRDLHEGRGAVRRAVVHL